MFKVGDKIVCIKDVYRGDYVSGFSKNCTSSNYSFIITKSNGFERKDDFVIPVVELYETYTIKEISNTKTYYMVEENKYVWYDRKWFISEKEYQISKRLEKLIKLKECLK